MNPKASVLPTTPQRPTSQAQDLSPWKLRHSATMTTWWQLTVTVAPRGRTTAAPRRILLTLLFLLLLLFMTGLLQCSSGWATSINTRTTATGDASSCSTCMRPFTKRSRDNSTLHWLPVERTIEFKLCLLIHQTINGRAPAYLKDLIETTASVPGRASNRSASNNDLVTRRTRLKLGERASPSLHHASGISCQLILKLLQTLKPSNENWKRLCFRQPTCSKTHIRRSRKSNCYLLNIVMCHRSLCSQQQRHCIIIIIIILLSSSSSSSSLKSWLWTQTFRDNKFYPSLA